LQGENKEEKTIMSTAIAPLSTEWPKTVFHGNGVKDQVVSSQDEFDRAMKEGWFDKPQEPPPPPPAPMTPEEAVAQMQSEVEGLGDQVDAQAQVIATIEEKIGFSARIPWTKDQGSIHDRLNALAESDSSASTQISAVLSILKEQQGKLTELGGKVSVLGSNSEVELTIDSLRQKTIALEEILKNAGETFAMIDGRLNALEAKKNKGAANNGNSSTDPASR
jgi:hypothetical protein